MNATTADEVLAFVPAGDEELFVVVTRPRSEPRGVAVVLLQGGGRRGQGGTPSPGRNRMSVELARSLAADGYHAVRLDYAGVGESSGDAAVFDVRAPFAEQIGAVTRWVAATEGVGRFAYMGGCFGGRAGLAAAAADPGTAVGVALWGSPLRDLEWGKRLESLPTTTYVRKAMTRRGLAGWADPTRRRMYRALIARRAHRVLRRSRGAGGGAAARASTWFSPMVARQLRTLFQHRVPVLVMYGEDDEFYRDFEKGRSGSAGDLLASGEGILTVDLGPGKLHGFSTIASQQRASEVTAAWLARITPAAAGRE